MGVPCHGSVPQPTAAQRNDVSLCGDLGQHHVVGDRGGLRFIDRTKRSLHGGSPGEFRYSCRLGSRLAVAWSGCSVAIAAAATVSVTQDLHSMERSFGFKCAVYLVEDC